MNNVPKTLIILVVVLIVATGAYWLGINSNNQNDTDQGNVPRTENTNDIPFAVMAKYNELEEKYRGSVGASLYSCQSNTDNSNIYIVEGSGGYTAEEFYYSSDGNLIYDHKTDDMVLPDEEPAQPPVDRSAYSCAIMN
ncbi:hypothetical protein BH23PAT2_BH23PAT2_08960 [soil metagenome]